MGDNSGSGNADPFKALYRRFFVRFASKSFCFLRSVLLSIAFFPFPFLPPHFLAIDSLLLIRKFVCVSQSEGKGYNGDNVINMLFVND